MKCMNKDVKIYVIYTSDVNKDITDIQYMITITSNRSYTYFILNIKIWP